MGLVLMTEADETSYTELLPSDLDWTHFEGLFLFHKELIVWLYGDVDMYSDLAERNPDIIFGFIDKPWYVVVERMDHDFNDLPAYKVGPFATIEEAEEEGQGEATHTGYLLTTDAKTEDYIAHECYWTQDPPEGPTFGPLVEMMSNER